MTQISTATNSSHETDVKRRNRKKSGLVSPILAIDNSNCTKNFYTVNGQSLTTSTAVTHYIQQNGSFSRGKSDENLGNKIFVGGLSWDTTQENLYHYFAEYGTITDCVLMIDLATGRSRGFGFVTFLNPDSVKAVFTVKKHVLDNKIIDPKAAVPKYIKDSENKNISLQPLSTTTNSAINQGDNGCSNGIVRIPSSTSATKNSNDSLLINNTKNGGNATKLSSKYMNNHMHSPIYSCDHKNMSSSLKHCVNQHHQRINSSPCVICANISNGTKIFVGGIGHTSEADLREYFQTFGPITEVNIMIDKATGRPRGFAFVGFSSIETADLTASMRYHSIRNKQVEVKKALPKDPKCNSNTLFSTFHTMMNNKKDFPYCYDTNKNEKINSYTPITNDEKTTNILQSSHYEGEWDFDDAIYFEDPPSNNIFTADPITSFKHYNTINTNHHNYHTNNSGTANSLQDYYFNDSQNNGSSVQSHGPAIVGSVASENKLYHSIFNTDCNNSTHLNKQTLKAESFPTHNHLNFGGVGNTASILSHQIPDDTKNSIVELLNEIWKSG